MSDEGTNLGLMKGCCNYNNWQAELIGPFVKNRTVLEVGSGQGSITELLFRNSKKWFGVDVDKFYVKKLNERFSGAVFKCGTVEKPNLYSDCFFDTVLLVNVLEHVCDDHLALKNCNRWLKDDGLVVGFFPAHNWAFGSVDKADGHFRRYSRANLTAKFELSGFKVRTCVPFNFVGLLGWLWHSKVKRLKTHNKAELDMFDQLVPYLSKIDSYLPIGLSWFVIAQKQNSYWYESKWWTEQELTKEINTIKYMERTKLIIEMLPKNKNVLDVGCGIGAVTQRISRRSKKTVGVDISKDNILIAKKFCKNKDLSFKVCAAEQVKGKYDVVVLNEVIEHLKNPFEMLKNINKILPKNGTLLLTTPNAVSLTNVAINLLKGNKDLGTIAGTEAEHIFLFDIRCLTRLLKQAGFNVVKYKTTKYSLVVEARKQCQEKKVI